MCIRDSDLTASSLTPTTRLLPASADDANAETATSASPSTHNHFCPGSRCTCSPDCRRALVPRAIPFHRTRGRPSRPNPDGSFVEWLRGLRFLRREQDADQPQDREEHSEPEQPPTAPVRARDPERQQERAVQDRAEPNAPPHGLPPGRVVVENRRAYADPREP